MVEEQNGINGDLNTLTRVIRKHKNFASADHQLCKATSSNRQSQKDDCAKECDYDEVEDFCTLLAKTGKEILYVIFKLSIHFSFVGFSAAQLNHNFICQLPSLFIIVSAAIMNLKIFS